MFVYARVRVCVKKKNLLKASPADDGRVLCNAVCVYVWVCVCERVCVCVDVNVFLCVFVCVGAHVFTLCIILSACARVWRGGGARGGGGIRMFV